jgi:hypothetical protein
MNERGVRYRDDCRPSDESGDPHELHPTRST